ncbi:hypothetical protein, partial [Micromonospora sp. NPDC049799]|uniref:hypothetical protein n=1 Tax=Micromonospora sp. NPDC049799 TaxID=3154741 RepID=UPI0033EE38D0
KISPSVTWRSTPRTASTVFVSRPVRVRYDYGLRVAAGSVTLPWQRTYEIDFVLEETGEQSR